MSDPAFPDLIAGRCDWLVPGLRRVLAPNPSALTGPGTNSYIVGTGRVAIIDPGPDDTRHLTALQAALAPDEAVAAIVVTHSHIDHSPLAARLAARFGAPVIAFGDAMAGRNPALTTLPGLGGGEGLDHDFRPDRTVADNEVIAGDDWELRVIHTPGHLGNHICLAWGDAIFSGDLAMGWATSIVSPPDGDMTAYMASLARLQALQPRVLHPGHGPVVTDAMGRLQELIDHRHGREAQIRAALAAGPGTAAELAARIYTDVDPRLLPAAARNVLAHLLDLEARQLARPEGDARATTIWYPR